MDESINTENKEQTRQKSPLSRRRIAGEILAGMAAGFAVGPLVTLGVIAGMAPRARASSEFGGAILWGLAVLYVFPVAYGLGSAVGVYLVGRIGGQTGSFLLTLGGGFLGGLGAIATLQSMPLGGIGMAVEVEMMIRLSLLPMPPLLATLGFNAIRRYRASFKREQKGKTGFGAPSWIALALIATILALVVLLLTYLDAADLLWMIGM